MLRRIIRQGVIGRVALLASCYFFQVSFASAGALTWNDCLAEARQRHPDLIAARERLAAARADKGITRGAILPQVTANAGADAGKTEGRSKTGVYSYGVSGRQLLFDGFKTSNDLAAAQQRIRVAVYNYQVVSSNVRLRLRTAFVGLLGAQDNVDVTRDILERRRQNLDLVTLQYQAGREHKGSLLTAEANAAQAGLDLVLAGRDVELYQRRLSKELGRPPGRPAFAAVTAAGDPGSGPRAGGIDRSKPEFEKLVETIPLLKELAAQKEAARFGFKSAKSDFFPQVYADAGAGKEDGAWPPETRHWSAGISLSFPIFQGGVKQAAVDKARAVYRQVQAEERSGRDGVVLTLAETWTQWQNAVDQEAVQQKFFQAATQRADIVEAQYRSGLATFNDWTIIEDDRVRNQKAVLQARTNALLSGAAWLQAKGGTVDE